MTARRVRVSCIIGIHAPKQEEKADYSERPPVITGDESYRLSGKAAMYS